MSPLRNPELNELREGVSPEHILNRIGEPYLSRRRIQDDGSSERRGLGLGVFIARTLLERTGATVTFGNRAGGRK